MAARCVSVFNAFPSAKPSSLCLSSPFIRTSISRPNAAVNRNTTQCHFKVRNISSRKMPHVVAGDSTRRQPERCHPASSGSHRLSFAFSPAGQRNGLSLSAKNAFGHRCLANFSTSSVAFSVAAAPGETIIRPKIEGARTALID